jgi:site-specific DNA-methyltransferase (adenine-specific)
VRDPGSTARRATSTSSFGVSRRESHDASAFYERFTPPHLSDDSTVAAERAIDRLVVGDARDMHDVPDAAVALVVTSPPYFAGKEYETALGTGHVPATYADYLAMLEDVFAECVRTLEPGGRIAVNVANLGRKPYRSLAADVTWILQDRLRLLLRGEVVWVKARGAAGSCAWGSFQRPANPVLRDLSERVVIASKGRFDRAIPQRRRAERGLPSQPTISRDEFMEATTDIWEIPTESASRVGHPAPFPVELPARLIQLYTYLDDLVLDPFVGSGSTAVAAVRTGRHYVGYDTDADYVAAAMARVATATPTPTPTPTDAAAPSLAARDIARAAIEHRGFVDVEANVKLPEGVDVTFAARDADGATWLFEVAGGFTTTRPGLRRSDTFWKALGKAAVLHASRPGTPFVLLTPARPATGTPAANALAAVVGPDKPIREVVELSA